MPAAEKSGGQLGAKREDWKAERIVAGHLYQGALMTWRTKLGKDTQGSRPRCVLLTDGDPPDVAERLTQLVNLPGVVVRQDDHWRPHGTADVTEVELDKWQALSVDIRRQLQDWWLAAAKGTARTPNWDIASTCTVDGTPGVLLVEAKAHANELGKRDKCGASEPNRSSIEAAIDLANGRLCSLTPEDWRLSSRHHYQLSNRFAWSWKLASLGVPVVLIYLGFLDAREMPPPHFHSIDTWRSALFDYCEGTVPQSCWDSSIDVQSTPLIPLVRVFDQPFRP